MKKAILLAIILVPIILKAQSNKAKLPTAISHRVQKTEYSNRTRFPSIILFKDNLAPASENIKVSQPNWVGDLFQFRAEDGLRFLSEYSDKNTNEKYYKFQQYYNEVPIEFSLIRFKEKEAKIKTVVGDYYLNVVPENRTSINKNQALEFAKAAVPAEVYKWELKEEENRLKVELDKPDFSYDPKTTLVILPINGSFRYAYRLDIYTHQPDSRYNVYIDAENGDVLRKTSVICNIDVKGVAHTKYHGTQYIQTDSVAPTNFILRENNRHNRGMKIETRNAQTGAENGSVDFTDTDNIWDVVNPQKDEAALDCHFSVEQTYDYYYDSLGRDSYDDNGSKLLQYMHFDQNWFNAQWTGSYSRYGDGNGEPLTSIDIVSHEITHGVTQFTAGLEYQLESGALNESFSDIFGTVVEFNKLTAGASWIIGQRSFALRDMSNPNAFGNPDCYGGKYWTNTVDCMPSGGNDWCGVHNNSGVQNFWFFLLSEGGAGTNDIGSQYQVNGIGMNKAARIAYKNLRDYLNPQSNYADARAGSIQAAMDLYGYDSPEMIAVMNAWYAVGVGQPYSFLPVANFKLSSPICNPNSFASFVNMTSSGQSYLWDFGDGATSTDENPTHQYSTVGSYTVKLIATNQNGIDTIVKNNFVKIFTDAPITSTCDVNMLSPIGTTGIYRVQFADIDNMSPGPQNEDPYMDYNCSRASLQRNQEYPIQINTHFSSPVFTRVYIDWNNNGAFDLPQELVMKTDNTTEVHKDTVLVPQEAVANVPLRMRVISAKATNNTPDVPCSGLRNGQIEDYSVVVFSGSSTDYVRNNSFKVYPNPAEHIINIQSSNEIAKLQLIDMVGKEILNTEFTGNTSIDVTHIPSGVYLIKLMRNNSTEFQKVVIK